jgi:chloramphenicol-sensitive protein RarD
MNKGVLLALGSYLLWGFLPLYMKALSSVESIEILSHRIVWSLVLLTLLLAYRQHWRWLAQVFRQPKILLTFLTTATLLSINWLTYIWAVQHHHIVDTSLGYFINPLVSVLLGVVLLQERLRYWQVIAVGVAAVGVLVLTLTAGIIPWVALTLAISFGGYGLLRKMATLNSLEGLSLETLLLFIPAFLYLAHQETAGVGAFVHAGPLITLLLIFTGVITAVPLLLFAAGARLIPLSTLGILQYFAPTIQFLFGVFLYGEALTPERVIGFSLIWLALAVFSLEGFLERRREAVLHYAS